MNATRGMTRTTLQSGAVRLARMLDGLGRITDDPGRLTRTFLSPAMRRANRCVAQWMREAGLAVREDAVGNLIGRLEGSDPGARTLLLGSHLDTVRDAGRFDGALGVLLPIVALRELRRRGRRLPFAVEVIGFSEEEGIRFPSAYLGSRGFTGRLRAADLARCDAGGTSVREALERLHRRPFRLPRPAHRPAGLLGYGEVHIEQGPVLEARHLAVGVVSAIAGQTRGQLAFTGEAGHAGTTPMRLRRDALAGAAEFVVFAEQLARRTGGLVATVGSLRVKPDAPNVIPSAALLSLDVRHERDATRRAALRRLLGQAGAIARRRGLRCRWQQTQDNDAVTCSPRLSARLNESVRAVQKRTTTLVSGAGHDAVVMSALTPVAMLFVRCRDGLSHHPDEHASARDLAVALDVVVDFLERLAKVHAS
jgi:allantoate deiminase